MNARAARDRLTHISCAFNLPVWTITMRKAQQKESERVGIREEKTLDFES